MFISFLGIHCKTNKQNKKATDCSLNMLFQYSNNRQQNIKHFVWQPQHFSLPFSDQNNSLLSCFYGHHDSLHLHRKTRSSKERVQACSLGVVTSHSGKCRKLLSEVKWGNTTQVSSQIITTFNDLKCFYECECHSLVILSFSFGVWIFPSWLNHDPGY